MQISWLGAWSTILRSFAVADGDLLVGKVDIFDAQTHAFHEA